MQDFQSGGGSDNELDGTLAVFGKHHASMYEGSMVGSGAVVFAVWGYVIAKMRPRKVTGWEGGDQWSMVITLNARLLGAILGEDPGEVEKAIGKLCGPDEESRTKKEEGRRLVRIGQFDYVVVNGRKYRGGRDPERRRAQNREAQARFREKKKRAAVSFKEKLMGGGGSNDLQGETTGPTLAEEAP